MSCLPLAMPIVELVKEILQFIWIIDLSSSNWNKSFDCLIHIYETVVFYPAVTYFMHVTGRPKEGPSLECLFVVVNPHQGYVPIDS